MVRRMSLLIALGAVVGACGFGGGNGDASEPTPSAAAGEPTAQASAGTRLKRIGSFDQPVHVTAPPRDRKRVFVVEKGGTIRVIRNGNRLATPFLDLRAKVSTGGEQGLLSMAFAPDYATSKRFYVYFTDGAGDTRVVEYRRATHDRARASSARQVLFQNQPESNHNGGLVTFGPDGLLYIGLGDGGGGGDEHGRRGNGQDLGTLLGKILRIDPRRQGSRAYRVPSDNPFVGRSGARPEIYAYGLRNPWRFSFDRQTADLVIADVGQNEIEEIDFVRKGDGRGANFGWRVFEGSARFANGEEAPGHVPPVHERTHSDGWCSITGGVVVRDQRLKGGLYGRYLFGDVCQQRIASGRLDIPAMRNVRNTSLRIEQLVSFGEDARNRVYAVSLAGPVYRLVAK
jgi:glucose/arabinose dehydrogenase